MEVGHSEDSCKRCRIVLPAASRQSLSSRPCLIIRNKGRRYLPVERGAIGAIRSSWFGPENENDEAVPVRTRRQGTCGCRRSHVGGWLLGPNRGNHRAWFRRQWGDQWNGSGGSAAAASTYLVGSAGSNSSGTGGGGSTGGATEPPPDPNTIVVNPPAYTPAPGMLRRLTRTQFRNALKDVFAYTVDISALDTDSWDANFASIGAAVVVTSDQGAEQYNTAVENAVKRSSTTRQAIPVHRLHADRQEHRHLPARLHSEAGASRLATGPHERRARWIGTLSAQRIDDPRQRGRRSALGDGRAVRVAELHLPAGAWSFGCKRRRRFSGYEMAGRLAFLLWNSLPGPDAAGSGGERDAGDG